MPTTGLPPTAARIVGLPGMTVTPCTRTSPPARTMAVLVKSCAPADEPPITSTMSKPAPAPAMTFAMASASSPRPWCRTASPPWASTSAPSTVEFDSMIVPGATPLSPTAPASTISPPVGMTRTRGLRRTGTSETPPASSAPVQYGPTRWRRGNSISVATMSSPTLRTFWKGNAGASMRTRSSPRTCTCSIMITAFLPSGMTSPVLTKTAPSPTRRSSGAVSLAP